MNTASESHGVMVSVVIPVFNEEENVLPLYQEICDALSAGSLTDMSWEVIFVDDGSSDRTVDFLRTAAAEDGRVTVIQLMRRFGQTAALSAGFHAAKGRIIVPMDGDRQNDPRDIPRLLSKLEEPPGWDIVSGWRKARKDKMLSRRLPSILANRLVRRLTWTPELHDFGCSLKAYRREVLDDVRLYGEMHRFLPAICKWRGARVTEVVVNHRPRMSGDSKYGLKRTIKVLLDLVTVKFLGDYLTKPIYFFGKLAMVTTLLSFVAIFIAGIQKLGYFTEHGEPLNLNNNVLVLFGMMLFLTAVIFIMMGVISELLVRIYHESQGITPYKVRQVIRTSGGGGNRKDSFSAVERA